MRRRVLATLCAALAVFAGCGQTVRVQAPPRSQLGVADEEPVVIDDEGTAEVRVPVGYVDPRFELRGKDGKVLQEGRLPRETLSGWWAAPIVGTTVCAAFPLGLCGFCFANPELLATVPLSCLSPQLANAGVNTLRTTVDTPSWPTVPAVVLCAGSAGLLLALLPFTMRVRSEITLLDEDSPLPAPAEEAMLW